MDIKELQDYRLEDAVKFNDQLNPAIWGSDERLLPQVREGLLAIAEDFKEFLGLSDLKVKDITISGSNAAYTYTPHSDVDLHLVVDMPKDPIYRELFDAKKYQYNDQHNFKVDNYDVELYVQDADQPHYSQGIYSILNNEWVSVPKRRKPQVDDISVKSKYEDLGHRIEAAIESGDLEKMDAVAGKIKTLRASGLEQTGEFGPENLAFKILRNNGTLDQLRQARQSAKDSLMSLEERKKKKKKKRINRFGGMWFPGFHYYGSNASGEADAGVGDGGGESAKKESIREQLNRPTPEPAVIMRKHGMTERDFLDQLRLGISTELEHTSDAREAMEIALGRINDRPDYYDMLSQSDRDPLLENAVNVDTMIDEFVQFVQQRLDCDSMPAIKIKRDPAWSERNKTFGKYVPDANVLFISVANRHPMDVLRTLAHELTHHRQEELLGMPDDAGATGSSFENEANAVAGILMRDFGQQHPEYFENSTVDEGVKQRLGAVAAAACIAGTPGCATTTTDVIKGVQDVGRTAKTFKNYNSDAAKEELVQRLKNELRRQQGHVVPEDYDPNATPPGPETPPTMPAGTVRVDVSDVYDWYKLGQHVSNLKGLGKHDFGAGPPSSIISFGDEDTEHKYIKDLEKTGLTTTDIDPKDPKQPRGMKRQKTDPTYNVAEASGYIPTEKEARDPRFSMALTQDIRPGQTGKEANKLGLQTDSQGRPALLMKKLNNLLESIKAEESCWSGYKQVGMKKKGDRMVPNCVQAEAEELDEVKMSPGALEKFANSPEAEGIQAGFEAEMIFRDTQGEEDASDYEADYDADERAYSIDQVVEFFENDDYGYGLTPRQADRLRNELDERYYEWYDEQVHEAFRNEQDDLIREALLEEKPMTERIRDALTQGYDFSDEEADRIIAAGGKAPRFTKLDDQEIYAEENPDYESYLKASEDADAVLDEEVEASIDNQDSTYDSALENFRDNYQVDDDSSFFTDAGLRWMSSIASEYDLDWPIMSGGSGNSGSRDWGDIADSLSRATGMKVEVGGGYHQLKRGDYYVLEPDGSLDPDDPSEEVGLEIVSPPMPLNKAIEQLQKVVAWADDEGDAYTNRSTGLHMGISVPFKGGNVDYVKLALFLGDEYVLEQFGRAANTYCSSAVKKLKQNVAGSNNRGDDKITSAMELMKSNLIELAERYVRQGVGDAKYTSIHNKPGYIEFRSPGGDYLSKGNRDIGSLENTMRRFARAMYIASRPDLERKEYYKKLYKLIAPEGNDALNLFAQFAAGEIDQAQLKKEWAEKTLAKEVEPEKPGQWVLYNRSTGERVQGQEYGNYKETDAVERAKAKISPASSMTDFLKAYKMVDMSVPQVWKVFNSETGEVYDRFKAKNRGEAMDQYHDKFVGRSEYQNADLAIDLDAEPGDEIKPTKKLSRRAELAKKISQPGDYVIINKHSGLPFYTFRATSQNSAVSLAIDYLNSKGLDIGNFSVQSAVDAKQAVDNARDSRQLQQRVQTVPGMARYEIVDRRTGQAADHFIAADPETAGVAFNNWLRNQGMPVDTENYGYRPVQPDAGAEQRAQNIRDSAPRADFEVYDSSNNNRVVSTLSNATAERVRELIQSYESPSGGYAPGVLRVRQVNESTSGPEDAQRALDAAAKKLGYANFAAVPQSAKNTVMQMAVNALKLDNGHYNMLDRKNK